MSQSPASGSGLRPMLAMVAGVTTLSSAPILVKRLVRLGMAPTAVGGWRMLLGGGVLVGATLARRRPLAWRSSLGPSVLLAGVLFGADLYLWHRAIVTIGAGIATVLVNTQVLWSAALARLLLGERVSPAALVAAPLGIVGVALLAGVGSGLNAPARRATGAALGCAAGLAYAGYILALRHSGSRAAERGPPAPASLRLGWISLASAPLLFAAGALGGEPLAIVGPEAWLWLAVLVVGPHVVGWMLIARALPRLPAARGALALLLQPALATVWAGLLFGEHLTPLQLCGLAVTLAAVFYGGRR